MAISKLDDKAVCAIGATQVLSDPVSVVKELIDNALDANATSITVEISLNTLDVIQVKDNGCGIRLEDRSMVARPNCTSKISGLDELATLGGSSLGFRGQALASIAEMSSSLTVSTRVEGEPTATALQVDGRGEVLGQTRTSLPVGTAVKVVNFLDKNPVRRQQALKHPDATLNRLKLLMEAYVYARPTVRLSLRALKSTTRKHDFTYVPASPASVYDAVCKLRGVACASHCVMLSAEDREYQLNALIPASNADMGKVNNQAAFVSVDGRPMATTRGVIKQVLKAVRDQLKDKLSDETTLKDPFFCLRFQCPAGSYDVNVEPMKDSVIFEDRDIPLSLVTKLFTEFNEQQHSTCSDLPVSDLGATHPVPAVPHDDFESLLQAAVDEMSTEPYLETPASPERAVTIGVEDQMPDCTPGLEMLVETPATPPPRPVFWQTMYNEDFDDEDMTSQPALLQDRQHGADVDDTRSLDGVNSTQNPWVIAKMNARPTQPSRGRYAQDSIEQTGSLVLPAQDIPAIPTPRPSSSMSIGAPIMSISSPPQVRTQDTQHPTELPIAPRILPANLRTFNSPYQLTPPASDDLQSIPLEAIPDVSQRRQRGMQRRVGLTRRRAQNDATHVSASGRAQRPNDHVEGDSRPKHTRVTRRSQESVQQQSSPTPLRDGNPRNNRSIRDLIASAAANMQPSTSNAPNGVAGQMVYDSTSQMQHRPSDDDPGALLRHHCFTPAEETAHLQTRRGLPTMVAQSLTGPVSSEQSTLPPPSEQVDAAPPAAPHRRRSSRSLRRVSTAGRSRGVARRKSSRLALERTPAGEGMQNLVYCHATVVGEIAHQVHQLSPDLSLLSWPSHSEQTAIYTSFQDAGMAGLTAKRAVNLLVTRNLIGEDLKEDLTCTIVTGLEEHASALRTPAAI